MAWYLEPASQESAAARAAAAERQSSLTKPPGSLGRLEALAIDLAALQDRAQPSVDRVAIRVFAGDHGVAAEGVSAFPQAVTTQMIHNFARGGAAIAVLARRLDAEFAVVNLGTAAPAVFDPGVVNLQLAPGTRNFCTGPAMDDAVLESAMRAGAEQVSERVDVFVAGEMGIANTTSAAAIASALLKLPPEETVGRGTGINDTGLARKRDAVARGLGKHRDVLSAPIDVLRHLGGLEIAALVGAYIRAAQSGVAVLVDGYICSVAALLACRINPGARPWLLFSHRSAEPGHRHVLEALQAQPLLDLDMRLGEGSGAAVALPLLQAACSLHNEMATFDDAGVSGGEVT